MYMAGQFCQRRVKADPFIVAKGSDFSAVVDKFGFMEATEDRL